MFASAALLIAALPLAFAQQAFVPEEPIREFRSLHSFRTLC